MRLGDGGDGHSSSSVTVGDGAGAPASLHGALASSLLLRPTRGVGGAGRPRFACAAALGWSLPDTPLPSALEAEWLAGTLRAETFPPRTADEASAGSFEATRGVGCALAARGLEGTREALGNRKREAVAPALLRLSRTGSWLIEPCVGDCSRRRGLPLGSKAREDPTGVARGVWAETVVDNRLGVAACSLPPPATRPASPRRRGVFNELVAFARPLASPSGLRVGSLAPDLRVDGAVVTAAGVAWPLRRGDRGGAAPGVLLMMQMPRERKE